MTEVKKATFDWKDVANTVIGAAPVIGTILGGPPLGAAVGIVGKLIGSLFGVKSEPDAVMAKIQEDPQALLKLKEMEMNNAVELQKLALQQQTALLADTQSARAREVDVVKATGKKDYNLYILAWTMLGGFFGLIALLMFHPVNLGNDNIIYILFGAMAAGFNQVLQYFFGSSAGSTAKSATIADLASKQ